MRKSSFFISFVFLVATPSVAQVRPIQAPAALADPRTRLPGGMGEAVSCVIGDFDGDGRMDFARAAADRVRVLFQEASGVFGEKAAQVPIVFGAAARCRTIAAGDFDGDLDLDLVVGLLASADLLLLNDGTGTFVRGPAGAIPPTPFVATLRLVVANFDGRGPDDLLVLAANAPPRLLYATFGGTFVDASGFLPSVALQAREVAAAGDLDRDGFPDLVLGGTALAPTLFLFNAGNGDFTQGVANTPFALTTRDAVIADVDGLPPNEVVLAPDAGLASSPVVLRVSRTNVVRIPPQAGGFVLPSWQRIKLGDLDGDTLVDLLALDGDGAVWSGRGLGNGSFMAAVALLDAANRRGPCVADFEPDGDLDVWVPGSTHRDAILLGEPGGAFTATEDSTSPDRGAFAGWRTAIVDATGDGDLDVMLCSTTGRFALWANGGGARFASSPLTPPDQTGLGSIVALLAGRLVASGSARDLFVVGQPNPLAPSGFVVFGRPNGGAWVDRSSMIAGAQAGRVLTAATLATFGAATSFVARSDLVLGDATGNVSVHHNDGSTIAAITAAIPIVHAGSVLALLSGDLDRDGAADVVVLPSGGPPEFHRALPPDHLHFGHVPGAFPTAAPALAGVIDDFDGDGRNDVIFATPGTPQGLTMFRGVAGGFIEVTSTELGALPAIQDARVLAALGPPDARRVVVGRGTGADLLIERPAGGPFRLVEALAIHGSNSTRELHGADLDTDGDDDLVIARADASPLVLLRSDVGLAARGPAQAGKVVRIDGTAPAGRLAFMLFSPFTMRVEVPPFGVLRLVSPATFLGTVVPPSGAFAVELVVPAALQPGVLPLQLVTLDPLSGSIELGNLEVVVLTRA